MEPEKSATLIDTESEPGSYARALEHSVHIKVSEHPNSTGTLLPGAARAATPSFSGGTGNPFELITSEHDREVAQP